MALYCFYSQAVKEDKKKYGVPLENFEKRLIEDQHTRVFNKFLPSPFLKKSFGRSFRLLAYEYKDGNDTIVRFCNLIQLFRAGLFGIEGIQPQRWWHQDENRPPLPVYFSLDNPIVKQGLSEEKNLTIIVNCENGEEASYVEQDDLLKQIVKKDEKGIPANVLSPMKAKGLEFNRVVLYKFGDSAPAAFQQIIRRNGIENYNPDTHLPMEYFLNRLYVAASRPRKRLFIIDSEEAIGKFWIFARKPEKINEIANRIRSRYSHEWAESSLCFIQEGHQSSWHDDREDPREIAKQYLETGKRERDSDLLRMARLIYLSCNMDYESKDCLATALKYENNLLEAGIQYKGIKNFSEALKCFWRGHYYQNIIELSQERKINNRDEYKSAMIIQCQFSIDKVVEFVEDLQNRQSENFNPGNIHWKYAIDLMLDNCLKLNYKGKNSNEIYYRIYTAFIQLMIPLLQTQKKLSLGELAYRAKLYEEAITHWNELETKPDNYYLARAYTSPYPQALEWFNRLSKYEQIIQLWEKNGGLKKFNGENRYAHIVAESYFHLDKISETLSILEVYYTEVILVNVWKYLLHNNVNNDDLFIRLIKLVMQQHIKNNNWLFVIGLSKENTLIQYLETYQQSIRLTRILKNIDNVLSELRKFLIYRIATSHNVVKAQINIQQSITEYLQELFYHQKSWDGYKKYVPVMVAGAAIERTGKITAALSFYNHVHNDLLDGKAKTQIQERLIRNLERRIAYLEKNRSAERKIKKMKHEIAEYRKNFDILDKNIPDYPIIILDNEIHSPRVETQIKTRQQRYTFQLFNFEFTVNTQNKTILIYHLTLSTDVRIDLQKQEISGDGNFKISVEDAKYSYYSSEWETKIVYAPKSNQNQIKINVKNEEWSCDT